MLEGRIVDPATTVLLERVGSLLATVEYLGVTELSDRFRSGALSPSAVTEQLLARIADLDSVLSCYVTVTADHARAQAASAEAELKRGVWRGPLHGVPIALKDLFETTFAPTTAGMPSRPDQRSADNAVVVQRLEQAGAVILGKLAMTEGAFSEHRPELPTPKNPWNADFWPGTSSSGSAAAVAAGLCFGALGTDTGGSIRYPSACSGITGLKPSRGLVSTQGVVPLAKSLDHVGPMARSALDCAALLSAIADAPKSRESDGAGRYLEGIARGVSGLRVGFDIDYATTGVSAEIIAALDRLCAQLQALGAAVRPVRAPPYKPAASAWIALCAFEAAATYAATSDAELGRFGRALSDLINTGRKLIPSDVRQHEKASAAFAADFESTLADVDLLVAPVMPFDVPSLAERASFKDRVELQRYTGPFNLSGHPTITFPAGFDRRGLPIGLQVIGHHLGEDVLLRTVHAFQEVTTWRQMRPPLSRATPDRLVGGSR